MNQDLLLLEPEIVWKNFVELTKIPRPSKHEEKVVEFLKNFALVNNLEIVVDDISNVIIKKPPTPGFENRKGIILQGHMDMVPQKNNDNVHDFEKDPIEAYIFGDYVKANGTTLGADNGIGLAAMLSILESKDIPHGHIEALFTVDEETGLTGASNLKSGLLKGDILLNLDSEEEGEICIGSAGGTNANIEFTYTPSPSPVGYLSFRIKISGLKGGHSGVDISLGRGNANKLLFRFLYSVIKLYDLEISSINGGSLFNAIPREAYVDIFIHKDDIYTFSKLVKKYEEIFIKEFGDIESSFLFSMESIPPSKFVIDYTTRNNLIKSVNCTPNDVIKMSSSVKDLVETSSNLAIVRTTENSIIIKALIRSSIDSAKESIENMFESIYLLAGAKIWFDGRYSGWSPNPNSPILKTMTQLYSEKFGKLPIIKAIHAGLECGIIGGVYPNLDMVSFGPTIHFPHSPDEQVKIKSVRLFWTFLLEILKSV